MIQYNPVKSQESAVSPVVGVMLMLVVTIIIAALVSAFSGSLAGGQTKTPQATIDADFSITDGMVIRHTGGDSLPTGDVQLTLWDGPTFGSNAEQNTKQVLDFGNLTDSSGMAIQSESGVFNTTAFVPGDVFTMSAANCDCAVLQPNIMPTDYVPGSGSYSGTQTARWGLCIKNPKNIGKDFYIAISDKKGNLIAKTTVKVTG